MKFGHPHIKVKIKVRATQNLIKNKMTGRVHILCRIFEKNAKKLKFKSQYQKKRFLAIFAKKKNDVFSILIPHFQHLPVILSFM